MGEDQKSEGEAGTVRSVERAIAILFSFTRGSAFKTVAELQADLGISRPTVYRLLQTLQRHGLVRGTGEPLRYTLDHRVMSLADTWLAQIDVARCAEEEMADLWARTDETVGLYVPLRDDTRIAISELRSKQPLSLGLGIGHTASVTQGASGRVILAFMEPERIEQVLKGVPDAGVREHTRADLERIQQLGYSVTVSSRIAGAVAIAAPVFDHRGVVAASLCLFGPETRLVEDLRPRYISLVVNAAAKISTTMGYAGRHRYPKEMADSRREAS
jgi:IclR family transcriptional regulator, acetate operon repressor